MMNDEIFYLESTLYIEKAMDEVREASLGVCESAEDGFLFESAGNVFQKLKEKIVSLMNKVKSLFTGKTMKKKDADAIEKSKNATGTIEVRDVKKLGKLQNDCMKDLNSGKDPEKVKKKWKKGLAILGFAAAGAAVAGGIAAGVKHKKKMNVKQLPAVIKDANGVVADANKNMSKPLQLVDKMSKGKISNRRAAKNGVILQGKSGSDGVIQQGMNKPGLPNKTGAIDSAFQKDIAARASVASEIYSDTSKAAVAIKNDCYAGVRVLNGGKSGSKSGKRKSNLESTMTAIEDQLKKGRDRLKELERAAKLPRNKNHGKTFSRQIDLLKNEISENEQRLAVVKKKAKRLQNDAGTYMAASVSSDVIKSTNMIIERANNLQKAINIMLDRADVLLESVSDELDGDMFAESSDELDVILGSSYMDDNLMLADESADDLMLAQESYEDIFGEDVHDIFADDDLMLADESADDYSDIFGDIDDEEAGC